MKMKNILILILLFISMKSVSAQNYVPNYSFELHYGCPDNYNQVDSAIGWHRSFQNNNFTHHTDYLNSCGGNIGFDYFTVPNNLWGYQNASTGDAYMCMATTAPTLYTDYRENFYCQLIQPLTVGITYSVSFKASKSNRTQNATNRIGIKFSTDTIFTINNMCQLSADSVIKDTTNWVTISGSFVADSAYKYLCVGNFFTDANTTFQNVCPLCPRPESEYYVDDICVHANEMFNCSYELNVNDLLNKNQFLNYEFFQDQYTNEIHIKFLNDFYGSFSISLVNYLGQEIYTTHNLFCDGKKDAIVKIPKLASSIYLLNVNCNKGNCVKKIFIPNSYFH